MAYGLSGVVKHQLSPELAGDLKTQAVDVDVAEHSELQATRFITTSEDTQDDLDVPRTAARRHGSNDGPREGMRTCNLCGGEGNRVEVQIRHASDSGSVAS